MRKELLSKFGEKGFEIDQAADVDKAYWENERMIKMLPPEFWEDDDHELHLSCHISKVKDPKFLDRASPEVKQAYLMHIQEHKMFLQQQQMQQQAQMQEQQAEGMQMEQENEMQKEMNKQEIKQAVQQPALPA